MEEMVEPDRTIMIVSIIALVIIWGSVAYHKFVQDGEGVPDGPGSAPVKMQADKTESTVVETSTSASGDGGKAPNDASKRRAKKRGKKRR